MLAVPGPSGVGDPLARGRPGQPGRDRVPDGPSTRQEGPEGPARRQQVAERLRPTWGILASLVGLGQQVTPVGRQRFTGRARTAQART